MTKKKQIFIKSLQNLVQTTMFSTNPTHESFRYIVGPETILPKKTLDSSYETLPVGFICRGFFR